MRIAGRQLVTVLVELAGAHLAAATAVENRADAGRAAKGTSCAAAWERAAAGDLQESESGRERQFFRQPWE